ncbi:hypothetical protein BRARA_I05418 [Brassica rapa]|uniref:VHS domain-containing protein n=2 Tax=Brassica campestris TaxID=3711 RepID=A0A397Y6X0_BRACM|nr:TOM1-like protein 2 [Brassica rapa]KAG5387491.1 hypothetical protein IGI04_038961 [Brassica rapa subsp. trilocularis]RID48947.1 hypothetical protein BRARA_I05418 [Brassica rapa]CAG7867507.1 unnamed protein product [Brassica rapa]VDC64430.1 unnamed protein product [Brassica rapa]
MDKLKIAEWGEKLKTGGAQMSRMLSDKFKDILQAPTLESKMVDEATLETLEEPNWGMNMRICAQINNHEFNATEIVRAIKRKISGKSPVSQRLSLELLEACAMNCDKIFSEVASERVLDEMVLLVKNGEADSENRSRAFQLVRAWGQSQDLAYLPVFKQTYLSLEGDNGLNSRNEENPMSGQSSLESLMQRPVPVPPPGSYPVPNQEHGHGDDGGGLDYNFGNLSIKDKKEQIEITRNSLELLSSMLNTEGKPNHTEDELTVSLMEKCKQSQPLIQMIIESTTDDETVLFEALHVNDELQRVLAIYEKTDESEKKASMVEQESSGSKDAGPKPTKEEHHVKQKDVDDGKHSESSGYSNKAGKEDKQVKIELGLSSDEDEK